MQLSYLEIENIIISFSSIRNFPLPIRLSYKLNLLLTKLQECHDVYAQHYNDIIQQYNGRPNDEKEVFHFSEVNFGEMAAAEIENLKQSIISVAIDPISIELFPDTLQCSMEQIAVINKLFKD